MAHGHKFNKDDAQKEHNEHRQASMHAMAQATDVAGRVRAFVTVQQQFFDKAIAEAEADPNLQREELIAGLKHLNELYKGSVDEIVMGIVHGIKE